MITVVIAALNLIRHGGFINSLKADHFAEFTFRFPVLEIGAVILITFAAGEGLHTLISEKRSSVRNPMMITIGVLGIIIAVMGVYYVSGSGLKYGDDKVRYGEGAFPYAVHTVAYEDVAIYQLNGYYHSFYYSTKDRMTYYEYSGNAYAIADDEGHYFEYGVLAEDSADYKKLMEILEKYNKEILPMNTVEDIAADEN